MGVLLLLFLGNVAEALRLVRLVGEVDRAHFVAAFGRKLHYLLCEVVFSCFVRDLSPASACAIDGEWYSLY